MEFLNPIAGYLALFALPIIVFYLLKVRLRQETISTTMFWKQIEEQRTHSIRRRLRYLFSLLLNLFFLLLLVGATLNPVFHGQKQQQTVIILDNSASMNASETVDGKTRLELAKAKLQRFFSDDEINNQTTIITSSGEPKVVLGFTNNLGTLRKAVNEITSTNDPTCINEAVELARLLVAGKKDLSILIYTDGCSADMMPLLRATDLRWIPIGKPMDNIAITKFQPRLALGDATGYEILVEIVNYSETALECRLEVELEGNPIDVIPLKLEPNTPLTQMIHGTTNQGGTLKAKLATADADADADAFPLDDIAVALLPARPVQKIIFFGEDDFFLERVLASQPNVELSTVAKCPESLQENTVLVIHRTLPETIPQGNVFVIDPEKDLNFCAVGELIDSPLITKEEKNSPLMKFVDLSNVPMPGARKLTPSPIKSTDSENELSWTAFNILVETPEKEPLYLQWDSPKSKILILSTNLRQGDLTLRTAFPIMVSNALNYFRGNNGELERACSITDALPLATHTEKNASPSKQIAYNLPNKSESNLRAAPAEFYELKNSDTKPIGTERPLWFWLTFAALLLSIIEWYLHLYWAPASRMPQYR